MDELNWFYFYITVDLWILIILWAFLHLEAPIKLIIDFVPTGALKNKRLKVTGVTERYFYVHINKNESQNYM